MVDRDNSSIPTIYIADRGYESYNNMAHVIEKGQKFVIRVKDLASNGIVSALSLPEADEFDVCFSLGLTRKQTNEVKKSNLKYLPHNVNFDFLPKTSRKSIPMSPYYISFRLVRFKLTEDMLASSVTSTSIGMRSFCASPTLLSSAKTRQPSSSKAFTVARPIPPYAPVTSMFSIFYLTIPYPPAYLAISDATTKTLPSQEPLISLRTFGVSLRERTMNIIFIFSFEPCPSKTV